ncbi:MAG: peptidylprolyl isomerase [Thermoanaerobaculia bacterium]
MRKTTMTVMAIAFSATVAMAQEKPAATPAATGTAAPTAVTTANADPIVVSSGDVSIHQSEFEQALKTLPAEYQQYAFGPGKRQFAEDFLRMKMLSAEGMKNGLDKDPDVLSQLALMKENLVANAQLQKIDKSIVVSDDDLKKQYEASKKDYEQVTARHILIAFKGSPAAQKGKKELTEAEAKAKAEEIRAKLVAGADFAETAKKESDDVGSGARGGELGGFTHGQMVPEFEAAAFTAKVGEITPVVKTQYGYHIIKVDKHDYTPFEQVKDTLAKKEHDKRVHDAVDAMKKNVTFNEAYFPPPAPPAPPVAAPAAPPAATPKADATKKPATPKKK